MAGKVIGPNGEAASMVFLDECDVPISLTSFYIYVYTH